MGVVETSDGFINIGVGGDGQWLAFCRALDRPDLAADPAYATGMDRFHNRPKLKPVLEEIFRQRSSAEWLELFEREGVPAGPIYRMDEVFADPQVQQLGMAVPVEHPQRGPINVVATPITLSRTPASVVTPIPDPGDHTQEILAEAGYSPDEIARLQQEKVV